MFAELHFKTWMKLGFFSTETFHMIFILKASVRYPSASPFSVQVAIVLLKRFHWLPMDVGLAHVLYICNNVLDACAA